MLRSLLWVLRQRRYAGLAALMLVIALICIGLGTFEITRYQQKISDNAALKGNAHAAAVPLTTDLVPLTGQGAIPPRKAVAYRTVTASGHYLPAEQVLVRDQSVNGDDGFTVLTPLQTQNGILLVVRGFVARTYSGAPPATIAAPPAGEVRVTGWLETGSTSAQQLQSGQVETVNPAEQSARLGAPVYQAYATLQAGQPGTAGLTALPDPDLSNPSGGAAEWQLISYVIQWYIFAALALVAPFVIARHEVREARRMYLGIDPGNRELASATPGQEQQQLTARNADATRESGAVALRGESALARLDEQARLRWQRAEKLADRYGRSIGPIDAPERWAGGGLARPASGDGELVPSAADQPGAFDAYHGSYNDYLWELALADGATPPVTARPIEEADDPRATDGDDNQTR